MPAHQTSTTGLIPCIAHPTHLFSLAIFYNVSNNIIPMLRPDGKQDLWSSMGAAAFSGALWNAGGAFSLLHLWTGRQTLSLVDGLSICSKHLRLLSGRG